MKLGDIFHYGYHGITNKCITVFQRPSGNSTFYPDCVSLIWFISPKYKLDSINREFVERETIL